MEAFSQLSPCIGPQSRNLINLFPGIGVKDMQAAKSVLFHLGNSSEQDSYS